MEIIILTVVFLVGIMLSLDIALAMLLSSVVLLFYIDIVPLHLVVEKAMSQISLYPLLAIPGFIVAGELMNVTGLTRALGNLAGSLVGRWRGGMGLAAVLACMFFGAMTGSGLAATVAIGSMMIPMLERHGYDRSFSAAIVASGGSLGPIIPPSIPMVIYASIAPTVSVAGLFIGGIVPGLLLGLAFMVIVWLRSSSQVTPPSAEVTEEIEGGLRIWLRALPAMGVPVIILYGTLGGRVTVTEAAVLAVAFVLLYGIVSRTLSVAAFKEAAVNTAAISGLIGFVIAAAGPFSFFLALYQAPQAIGNLLLTVSYGDQTLLIVILVIVLFILGCLVEATSLVIILAPILAATATIAGIDQLHMAIVAITTLMIGLFTPPVGTNLFAVVGVSGEPVEKISKQIMPFVLAAVVVAFGLAVTPVITTIVPFLLSK